MGVTRGGPVLQPPPLPTPAAPGGLLAPFDVQMSQPGQEKPRGFMNSSSMMSFQSYPPEEHSLSPSSPAAPSQAFLSPPPSQAWGAKFPLQTGPLLSPLFPIPAGLVSPDCSPMEGAEPEMKSCNSIHSQPTPCQLCNSRAVEKRGTNNCDGNHSLETSRGNDTPARGKRIIKR